jgi:alkylation response protein AidB-like acyl-CoA dehydrogenase
MGDKWIINGQKLWTTGAGLRGSVINTYVRTDREAHYRNGMSLILIDNDLPGVELRKLEMLGRRCTGTYEVFLCDVEVGEDRVIGGVNQGWDCLLSGLQVAARIGGELLRWGTGHRRSGGRLQSAAGPVRSDDRKLSGACSHAGGHANRSRRGADADVARGLAGEHEPGRAPRDHDAKLFAAETYVKVANMGVQIMGGYGLNAEFDMQRHFRDAKSATIAAGTSQTQRNLIASLMGLKTR